MKDALDTTFEVSKVDKYSLKRCVKFEKLKESLAPDNPGIRMLHMSNEVGEVGDKPTHRPYCNLRCACTPRVKKEFLHSITVTAKSSKKNERRQVRTFT